VLKLIVEGFECDLKGDENISIDYAMMSIDDISKRKGSRSFTFDIPKTANNVRIFETSEQVTNLTQVPYSKLTARLLDNGIDLGVRFAELVASKKNYSINLYGDSASFYEIIKNRDLTSLDLSEFNHTYNFATVVGSRSNDVGDGYIYPIINYGTDENVMGNIERVCQAMMLLPAMYLDDVLPKIFSEAGYTLTNNMLATGLVFGNKYNATFGISTDTVANPSVQGAVNIIDIDSISSYTGNYYTVPQNSTYTKNGTIISSGSGIKIQDTFDCKFRLTMTVENSDAFPQYLRIYMTGTPQAFNSGYVLIGQPTFISPGSQQYVIEGDLNSDNGQWLGFEIKMLIPQGHAGLTVKAGATFEIYEADDQQIIYQDAEVECAAFLPQMKQSDFLRNYCQMFCLLPIIDEGAKTVTLINFNQVEKNINEAEDWSAKLDLTDEPEVKYLIDEYAQSNSFKWMKDEEEQQPVGTNGYILIGNENLEQEKEIVELQFASTFSDLMLLDIPVPRIGIFEVLEYKKEKKPRLLILHRQAPDDFADTSDFTYAFGLTTTVLSGADLIPLCRFIDPAFDYNLGFGNSLLDYYSAVRNITTNYKEVNAMIRLNASDINQLDFMNPVYIKYFNAYFYKSKISGYKAGNADSTQVQLVKLF